MSRVGLAVAVSRPYYWLVTCWLYLLPTGGRYELFDQLPFWLGLSYCTLPLNLFCYLMNDASDVKVDAPNPRKGGALLGAKADAASLRALWAPAACLQLGFVLVGFAPLVGAARSCAWLGAVAAVNWLYNHGPRLSSNYAPLDLFCPCGYILVVPLSCWLNELPYPPTRSWVYCVFLVLRSQLWISTFDIESDRASGRRNTAVRLGLRGAQLLLAALLVAESAFVLAAFEDWALQSFSVASVGLLAAQLALLGGAAPGGKGGGDGKARPGLSPASINTTFAVLGLGGVGLMLQVWVNEAFR